MTYAGTPVSIADKHIGTVIAVWPDGNAPLRRASVQMHCEKDNRTEFHGPYDAETLSMSAIPWPPAVWTSQP